MNDVAQRVLQKVQVFVRDQLDDEERLLFGALVAPGIAQAYRDDEVEGFEAAPWAAGLLPQDMADAVRERGVRVAGLDGSSQ